MTTEREARLIAIDESYGSYMRSMYGEPFYADGQTPVGVVAGDYVLVERSTYDGSHYYITVHDNLDQAARVAVHHATQEWPEGWKALFVINVATAQLWYGSTEVTYKTTFSPTDHPMEDL